MEHVKNLASIRDLTILIPVCLSVNSTADQDLSTTSDNITLPVQDAWTVALGYFFKLSTMDDNLVSTV